MRLYIIRHGQPADEKTGWAGRSNPPLDATGRKQAERTAEKVSEWGLDYLYSSTLRRALDTAEALYHRLHVPWHVWAPLCETGRGDWPKQRELQRKGIDPKESVPISVDQPYHEQFPKEDYPLITELAEQYNGIQIDQPFSWPDAWWVPLQNETREEAFRRAHQVIDALKARHIESDARAAVVCHGAFGFVLLTVLSQGTPCDFTRFSHCHAAISCVDLHRDGSAIIRFSNYFQHLDDCAKHLFD